MVDIVENGASLLFEEVETKSRYEVTVEVGIVNEHQRMEKIEFVFGGKSEIPGHLSQQPMCRVAVECCHLRCDQLGSLHISSPQTGSHRGDIKGHKCFEVCDLVNLTRRLIPGICDTFEKPLSNLKDATWSIRSRCGEELRTDIDYSLSQRGIISYTSLWQV